MGDTPEAEDLSLDDAASLLTGDGTSGMLTGEFGKQLGGSAMANFFTLLLIGVYMGLKKLCNRPSKCKSHVHCPCIDVDIVDRDGNTLRTVPKTTDDSGSVAV